MPGTVPPQLVIGNDEIFDAHVGGKLSVELKAPPDTRLDSRVGEAVAAAVAIGSDNPV